MEAWKDELYHYGIKGMKWGKRKKASLEQDAKSYESSYRHMMDVDSQFQKTNKGGYPSWSVEHKQYHYKAAKRAHAANKIGKYRQKINRQIAKDGGDTYTYSSRPDKPYGETTWKRGANSGEKNKQRTRRRVKRAEAKYKAKSYIKNLFKRKKK